MMNVITPKGRAEIEQAWTGEFLPLLTVVSREFDRHEFHLDLHIHRTEVSGDMSELVLEYHENIPVELFLEVFQLEILNHRLVTQSLVRA